MNEDINKTADEIIDVMFDNGFSVSIKTKQSVMQFLLQFCDQNKYTATELSVTPNTQ